MNKSKKNKQKMKTKNKKGRGLINNFINKLPFEMHLPKYQYCGPGTHLSKRLYRGDPGINELDKACREHDISYDKYNNISDRHTADKLLAGKAWRRVIAKDSNLKERANAFLVASAMKVKTKLGLGCRIKKANTFLNVIKQAKKQLKKTKSINVDDSIKLAVKSVKKFLERKKSKINVPRIIPVPKTGGFLPALIPIFAGLSAIGALSGGAAGIAKAVNDAKAAKKQMIETKRHNQKMETVAIGRGLHLKPYKKGMGLFLIRKNF